MRLSSDDLSERVKELKSLLESCTLCPRQCRVNRLKGETGFCKTGNKAVVAGYGPHFGEERCLVGKGGSGTIFFSWCNLRCIYCQNYEISWLGQGDPVNPDDIALIIMTLKASGCENINLVTPTHVLPFWVEALQMISKETDLDLPIIYNTSGYENVNVLRLLDGIVDIYMPDFKYWNRLAANRFSQCKDYPKITKEAIKEMHRQVGDLVFDKNGTAKKGLLVRHLVLPGGLSDTMEIVEFIAQEISSNTYMNIMDQYRPCGPGHLPPPMNRRITDHEYNQALRAAGSAGLQRLEGRLI
ncbi:radical SAM protein [Dissulfurimicrobium hydrothermale]|uniref:radical SAM protein n=1 Tax=Dissulfurimicrobium hydrothermale TaxID=1750598 RepID=UPI001EDA32DB|nr:radical SAM protein [Dissulfurimicrobium hydrothermale]UKL13153.1 radical SAM protein [Dissulfurimicrobium hydrothermale]